MLAAWLCANGAALDVVQAFAWARMFTGYARTAPLACAAAETFDPGKPCPLCQAVQKARESGARQPAAAPVERITLLICQRADVVLTRPPAREWPEMSPPFAPAWRQPVSVPPPKLRLA
jgi:hypothetical protein